MEQEDGDRDHEFVKVVPAVSPVGPVEKVLIELRNWPGEIEEIQEAGSEKGLR